ncbi:hypothetical protein [Paenibacillus polymyxa]|uniref:hypothetical protein n=1 Tax=Paenibacillus polymyxa TaxID=1406 RepID=UPI002379CEED|nr:hypothetical protein [Paenibacillus polymyxa]WDM21286.1 hypothetical protein J4I02_20315 [Paenibacillus polymyxa]
MDKIQQLIDINDRASAIEYLEESNKKTMHQVACRLIFKGLDDAFITRITSRPKTEIKELRAYLTFEEVMDELGLSEKSLKRFIRQGFTANERGIPRYAIELLKDPIYSILMQMEFQKQKLKTQTVEERIEEIRVEIMEFEEKFEGKFDDMFGHLPEGEILLLDFGDDIKYWKYLIEELREIDDKKRE